MLPLQGPVLPEIIVSFKKKRVFAERKRDCKSVHFLAPLTFKNNKLNFQAYVRASKGNFFIQERIAGVFLSIWWKLKNAENIEDLPNRTWQVLKLVFYVLKTVLYFIYFSLLKYTP